MWVIYFRKFISNNWFKNWARSNDHKYNHVLSKPSICIGTRLFTRFLARYPQNISNFFRVRTLEGTLFFCGQKVPKQTLDLLLAQACTGLWRGNIKDLTDVISEVSYSFLNKASAASCAIKVKIKFGEVKLNNK